MTLCLSSFEEFRLRQVLWIKRGCSFRILSLMSSVLVKFGGQTFIPAIDRSISADRQETLMISSGQTLMPLMG